MCLDIDSRNLRAPSACENFGHLTGGGVRPLHCAQGRVVKSDGNDTECAMLLLANSMLSAGGMVAQGAKHYWDIRQQFPLEHPERLSIPFSSERKMMSTVVPWDAPGGRWGGGTRKVYRLFTKGAADFVLRRCGSVLNADGSASPLTADRRAMLEEEIAQFAGAGLRTLSVAFRDFDQQPEVAAAGAGHGADEWQVESKLTLVGLIGMEDHVRPEVPEVRKILRAVRIQFFLHCFVLGQRLSSRGGWQGVVWVSPGKVFGPLTRAVSSCVCRRSARASTRGSP